MKKGIAFAIALIFVLSAVSCNGYIKKEDIYFAKTADFVNYASSWQNDFALQIENELEDEIELRYNALSKVHFGVDRPYGIPSASEITAKYGDTVEMHVLGVCNGEIIENEIRKATLGKNSLVDGFEEHLLGKRPGDKFSFDVVFPKDYGEYAKQTANFEVEIKIIYRTYPFEYCDEFIYLATDYENKKTFEKAIKKELLEEKYDEIISLIIENTAYIDDSKIKNGDKNEFFEILAIRAAGEEKGIIYTENILFEEYKTKVFQAIIKEMQ